MDHDREQAIGQMLEQTMNAVEANLRAITAQLRAFDFAARAVSDSYLKSLVQAHKSAVQQAKVVAETLAHWGSMLEPDAPPSDPQP